MKRINLFVVTALLALGPVSVARAVVTQKVTLDTFAEFSAGEFDNVSLTGDGHLELAPAMTNLASVTDPIIWAAVQDGKDDVFFGTGNQGKVYQLTPKGELATFFAPNEVMVHALAMDSTGRLYAATSPEGRVYRLDAKGQAEVYCAPGETYLWAMTFGRDGSLYLATGDHGKILRVPPAPSTPAKAGTYFATDEKNITALAWDKDGNLLAGTSPHGYLYRIDKANHGFVVFNSGENEIKQIAVAADGTIYVSTFTESPGQRAASGTGRPGLVIRPGSGNEMLGGRSSKADMPSDLPAPSSAPNDTGSPTASVGTELAAALRGAAGVGTPGGAEKSPGAIYRIDTNGFYERFWSTPDGEAIYSMTLLPDGSLLAGTGDKGRIYSITDATHWKLLQQVSDGAQVAALLPAHGEAKECFAATSHPAKLYRLDFSLAKSGTYTSKAFDARQKSLWGRMHPDGEVPAGTKLEFSTRSGNTEKPEKTWSDWSSSKPLGAEIAVTSPSARYLQYRVEFKRDGGSPSATAQLQRLQFYYQNANAAPVISRVKVHNEGFGISKLPVTQLPAPAVNLNQLLDSGGDPAGPSAANPATAALMAMLAQPPLREVKSPGLCTVVWEASDPNQDKLTYSVAIRAEADKPWTLLVDKTEDTFYSFDTSGFREGLYFIKVTASDLPGNTPETARTAEAVSDAFLIDNTPPVLTVKKQILEKDYARIFVEAVDGASVISSATYSLDGQDEVALRPDDLIFDSTNETFTLELTGLNRGAHGLLLRVQDEAKNASVLKLNFESK
jgi:sugar lactone lactonase YvrE